ncbi:ABC transporter, duplicated ATPase subunits [Plesiocystis pacifica SIR-1]|uniref:ABC transporter, duplicated ATPase subunits n=1 Tax=Plesiocystis pacifica SIR-1 TaxID=391625 RepID=A6G216_9BACT|nr:ABC-F family ATP-binding cassette domain-containing protein [Plesiocystis pacifica]EDM79985.1 ABC transporter, duplicated ATPase subunits [Plesiocystis pacifica SIR-1]
MISLDKVCKRYGSQLLYVDASMAVFRGETVGLVGPNGAGKSTIFRLIVGEDEADEGAVSVEKGVTIGYFDQDVGEMSGRSVLAETLAGAGEVSELAAELHALEQGMADPERADELDALVARYGEVQPRFDALGGYELEPRAQTILAGLGFSADRVASDVSELSGGWKMRVALARILLMAPDVLLLDEPTNHLDLESILWLEGFLRDFEGALVMTSHDRELLNRLVTKIVEIDGGELRTYSGDYDFYERQRDLAMAQHEAQYARQQAALAKERAFIARFAARASHAAQVQSRVKKLDKIDKLEPPRRRKIIEFDFPAPKRSGNDVAVLEGVDKAYGDLVIYAGLSHTIRRLERWCVLGINGAGKSTLLKLIAGETQADAGVVKIGPSVTLGYYTQHAMDSLDGTKTVLEDVQAEHPRASQGSLRNLLGAFGFSGDDVDKPCRVLSGGEKARVVLAKLLYVPPNFLVLDEPTNHLDVDTKQMLVKALSSFEGTMLFVSHDRRFLAELSNRVLELTPEGPRVYGGGYSEYVEQTEREGPGAPLEASRPARERPLLSQGGAPAVWAAPPTSPSVATLAPRSSGLYSTWAASALVTPAKKLA